MYMPCIFTIESEVQNLGNGLEHLGYKGHPPVLQDHQLQGVKEQFLPHSVHIYPTYHILYSILHQQWTGTEMDLTAYSV